MEEEGPLFCCPKCSAEEEEGGVSEGEFDGLCWFWWLRIIILRTDCWGDWGDEDWFPIWFTLDCWSSSVSSFSSISSTSPRSSFCLQPRRCLFCKNHKKKDKTSLQSLLLWRSNFFFQSFLPPPPKLLKYNWTNPHIVIIIINIIRQHSCRPWTLTLQPASSLLPPSCQ